jgi:hypothetical protein
MSEMGIPMKLVKLTRPALKRVRSRVKVQGIISEIYETERFETRRFSVMLSL